MNRRLRVAGTALGAFTLIAVAVFFGWTTQIDAFGERLQLEGTYPFFMWWTRLGSIEALVGGMSLAVIGLIMVGDRRGAVFVVTNLFLTLGSTFLLKLVFMRPRPMIDASLDATTYSFPSAHAAGAMALFGAIAYVLVRRGWSAVVWYVATTVVILISFSRIVLDVHYVSDVFGGWFWGLAVMFWLDDRFEKRWRKRL